MRQTVKKLRSQSGESIAETLIAVLIIAVAMMMLATMITATANMVLTSENKMDSYYKENAGLETLSSGTSATITIKNGGTVVESVSAIYKTNNVLNKPVTAYCLKPGN